VSGNEGRCSPVVRGGRPYDQGGHRMTRTSARPHHTWRTSLALLALTAGGLLGAAPAFARSPGPHWLSASELPPHPSSRWYAGPVTAGRPDPLPFCGGETLPSTASHRTFRTDVDAH